MKFSGATPVSGGGSRQWLGPVMFRWHKLVLRGSLGDSLCAEVWCKTRPEAKVPGQKNSIMRSVSRRSRNARH